MSKLSVSTGPAIVGTPTRVVKKLRLTLGAFQLKFLALSSEILTSECKWNAALMFEVADS